MKKIILVLSALATLSMAGSVEEDKKACDNNNLQSCLSLMERYSEGKGVKRDLYQAYQAMYKIGAILEKKCENGHKKSCTAHPSIKEQLNFLPATFIFDGVFSGMTQNELLDRKFEKRTDGLYNVETGTMNTAISTLYGGKIEGDFLTYSKNILNKKAIVKIFLTEKSKKVYAVIVEWKNSGIDFGSTVKSSLSDTYGSYNSIDKLPPAVMNGKEWKPNERATVSYYLATDEMMNMNTYLTFVDKIYYKQNKEEK
ncbi:hypothetical protein [Sulfurovum sp. TSL1]|uniref:hypothetical protein n=1 Tax=Sulfurovum sp. TSL1 TaxID=2826994 RepID=UPI001CC7934D|nr:hypothetical protein [Sulfurovum sp. TSL1]GIT98520.1 hypothetical protein TSL1_13410 [Sulfurovum sp. TSL1]